MNKKVVRQGMEALARVDDDIAHAWAMIGDPEPRKKPAGFSTFMSTIVSQQISTHAAKAVMGRVNDLVPTMTPIAVLETSDEDLRAAGMSYRKIEYAKGLALSVMNGDLNVDGLKKLPAEEAIAQITALRGFGRWSAEIYIMFSLGNKDIFPADDLALQVALGRLKGMDKKPTPKVARQMCEHWAPWRTVGSLFLWHYYRGMPE